MIYSINRRIVLPIGIKEAWDFFSSPLNLQKITPDFLGFKIINKVDDKAYSGQIIVYRIKPLLGIEMEWVTEITQVEEFRSFIDSQLSGPYKIWHHEHRFEACSEGTMMTDLLYYQLPFGWLGDLVHTLFIRNKVHQIFDYREVVLKNMFTKPAESKV